MIKWNIAERLLDASFDSSRKYLVKSCGGSAAPGACAQKVLPGAGNVTQLLKSRYPRRLAAAGARKFFTLRGSVRRQRTPAAGFAGKRLFGYAQRHRAVRGLPLICPAQVPRRRTAHRAFRLHRRWECALRGREVGSRARPAAGAISGHRACPRSLRGSRARWCRAVHSHRPGFLREAHQAEYPHRGCVRDVLVPLTPLASCGTLHNVSTLFTQVGLPHTPEVAGR
ncbi:hypothetical protein KCP71_14975 [Salmonella enterica subsp. enterica]|nr:hypothetical protein KCP71_14975 [Salmonella enterica subsp. enterica]